MPACKIYGVKIEKGKTLATFERSNRCCGFLLRISHLVVVFTASFFGMGLLGALVMLFCSTRFLQDNLIYENALLISSVIAPPFPA